MIAKAKKTKKGNFTKGKLYEIHEIRPGQFTTTDDEGWQNHTIAYGRTPTEDKWFNEHFNIEAIERDTNKYIVGKDIDTQLYVPVLYRLSIDGPDVETFTYRGAVLECKEKNKNNQVIT